MPSNKTNPGEGENITDLYKKYYPLWKKIAFSICQENDLADDIVLESFTKLISKKELLELLDPSARMVYLKTTVRNTALKLMSKRLLPGSAKQYWKNCMKRQMDQWKIKLITGFFLATCCLSFQSRP